MNVPARDNSLGAYDATTGYFTIPENGQYEMTLHLVTTSTRNYNKYVVDLVIDDQVVDTLRYSSEASTVTNTLTTEIEARVRTVQINLNIKRWFLRNVFFSNGDIITRICDISCVTG